MEELSYVDTKPDTSGEIKRKFSDFKVDEYLSFDPTGCGDHLFIKIKKTGLTTVDVAKKISEVTGSKLSTVGYSGMKDKYGECTQWFSAPLSESVSRSLGSIENANLKEASVFVYMIMYTLETKQFVLLALHQVLCGLDFDLVHTVKTCIYLKMAISGPLNLRIIYPVLGLFD